MTKTQKQKNVITEEQSNVFDNLKKKAFKRGQGLTKPPSQKNYGVNIEQQENNEAVAVKEKRTARISTYITTEASDMIDEIIMTLKKRENKKPKIAKVLEMAIEDLHKKL